MTIDGGGPGAVALGPEDAVRARDAVKQNLRIGHDAEDALIERLASEAAALAEAFTGQILIVRELRATVAGGPFWQRIAASPVHAVTAVDAIDAQGAGTASPVGDHAIDIDARGDAWIRFTTSAVRRARVTMTAGIAADWDSLPPPIAQGIVRMAAYRLIAREDDGTPPAAVAALWRPWRVLRLAETRR